ncbi:MAG: methyltransferase [Treponema sp.]|jgi:23S rRNA (uracil1939-C5)-methyltransferase|nr:methyltransferase [Treponema sp.]
MAIGELFSAAVERIAVGGAGILSLRGKRVFMDRAVPGDVVAGRIIREKRDWAQAELVAVESPSPRRVEPRCPLFGTCGGCSLQCLAYEVQAAEKTLILRDAFARLGGVRLTGEIPFVPSPPWEYRNRIQLHYDSRGGALGFKARRGNAVVPAPDCPIADPGIRGALREFSARPPAPSSGRFTLYARDGVLLGDGIIHGKTMRRGSVPLRGKEIRLDAGVFFQSNGAMLEALIGDLLDIAAGADTGLPMADLYCGVGVFAAFLGALFPRTDLVEENSAAIVLARENTRGLRAELFAQTVDRWAANSGRDGGYGFMVVDPPRQGLSPALRQALVRKGPPVLAYVSCDAASLARDSGELIAGGYRLELLRAYDFYPQTSHIESLAVFAR